MSFSVPSLTNTVLVRDIRPGINSSNPTEFTNIKGNVFFAANEGVHGTEIWKSNGNGAVAAPFMVKDIRVGATGSNPTQLLNINGQLVFTADNGTSGVELWTLSNPLAPGGLQAITAPSSAGILTSNSAASGLVFEPSRRTLAQRAQRVELASPPRRISHLIRSAPTQEINTLFAESLAQIGSRNDFNLDSQFAYDELVVYYLCSRSNEAAKRI